MREKGTDFEDVFSEVPKMHGSNYSYIAGSLPYILAVTVVFILSCIIGYITTSMDPDSSLAGLEGFEELIELISSLSPVEIMLFIFFNNAIKSLMAMILGLGFGVIPLIFVISNGYILGVVGHLQHKENGLLFILAGILPHGIIELPMILISAGLGLRLGHKLTGSITGRNVDIKEETISALRAYLRIIMPLLLLAAIIETFITPLFIAFVSA